MNYQGTIKTAFQRELRTVCFFFLCFCITVPKTGLICSSAWARMKTFLPTGQEVREIINFTSQNRKAEFIARRHQNKNSGNKKRPQSLKNLYPIHIFPVISLPRTFKTWHFLLSVPLQPHWQELLVSAQSSAAPSSNKELKNEHLILMTFIVIYNSQLFLSIQRVHAE